MTFSRKIVVLAASLAVTGASAAPASAATATDLPCVDAGLISVGCPAPAPAPSAAPAPRGCVGADLIPDAASLARARAATLCLVNAERTKRGLKRLKPQAHLDSVAKRYARRMARENFFEHTSPDGGTFVSRIKQTRYLKGSVTRWSVGENIAWGTYELATPGEIVKAWMASPGHRRNILDKRFTEMGMAVVVGAPQRGVDDTGAATYANEFGLRKR